MQKNNTKSKVFILCAMFIFGSVGIFRKYIPLPSSVLACYRGICGALFLSVLAKTQKRKLFSSIEINKLLLLILSGAVMGLNWMVLFEAYNYTSVATATLCYYMQPIIVVLVSPMLFGEKITLKKFLCVTVAVIGMVFVSGIIQSGIPSANETKGIIYGLGAAFMYAFVVVLNKKLDGVDVYQRTVLQLAVAAIAVLPYILLTHTQIEMEFTIQVIVLLLIIGFVHTGIAYAMYFGSIEDLRAQTIALFSYVDPVTALVLSAVVLHESISGFEILGAIMIIGAALFAELDFKKRRIRESN